MSSIKAFYLISYNLVGEFSDLGQVFYGLLYEVFYRVSYKVVYKEDYMKYFTRTV